MASRLLIMGSSKTQNSKEGTMPAALRYNSLRWQVFRELLEVHGSALRIRTLVISPEFGIISPSQPIPYSTKHWTGSTWRKDVPFIHEAYNRVLRSQIDPGTDIFVSADAIAQMVLNECGLQQDVVQRAASMVAPTTTHGIGIQMMRRWMLEGVRHAT